MIDISKLTKADIGKHITYRSFNNVEHGVLSSWNKKYIFVRFKGPGGEACRPEDVEFDFPRKT